MLGEALNAFQGAVDHPEGAGLVTYSLPDGSHPPAQGCTLVLKCFANIVQQSSSDQYIEINDLQVRLRELPAPFSNFE
jgi:hypothetical protein